MQLLSDCDQTDTTTDENCEKREEYSQFLIETDIEWIDWTDWHWAELSHGSTPADSADI